MSLNKFTDVATGKEIGLEIGCKKLEADEVVCDTLDVERLPSGLYSAFAPVTIQNTDTPTTLFGVDFVGDTLLPADELKEGYVLKVSFGGDVRALSQSTIQFTLSLGFGGSVAVVSVLGTPQFSQMGDNRWSLEYVITCHNDGLINKAYTVADFYSGTDATPISSGFRFDSTVDFSTQQRVDCIAQWSSANVANRLIIDKAVIERVR
jgi:hypothetical protein